MSVHRICEFCRGGSDAPIRFCCLKGRDADIEKLKRRLKSMSNSEGITITGEPIDIYELCKTALAYIHELEAPYGATRFLPQDDWRALAARSLERIAIVLEKSPLLGGEKHE